jgi:broad specificity phosphatase PhoE
MSTGIDREAAVKKVPAVAAALKAQGIDSLVSSTLPRAEQSMNLIAREMGDDISTQSTSKLKTWNTGDKVAGKPEKETLPLREKYIKNSEIEMPGGESWDDFMDRFGVELRDIQKRRGNGEEVALIGHGHHLLAVPALLSGQPVDPKKLASLDEVHEPGGVYAFYKEGTNIRIERLDQQENKNT